MGNFPHPHADVHRSDTPITTPHSLVMARVPLREIEAIRDAVDSVVGPWVLEGYSGSCSPDPSGSGIPANFGSPSFTDITFSP